MATPFPQTLRALRNDNSGRRIGGLFMLLFFLAAWLAWFMLVEITRTETAVARLLSAETAEAFLPPEAINRVRPGQPAWLILAADSPTSDRLPATVTTVSYAAESGRVRVQLALAPVSAAAPGRSVADPPGAGRSGKVEIEVERLTPAALVLRLAGLRDDG